MKDVEFSTVESNLPVKEYALPLVELVNQFPARDGKKTLEYCFRRQQASKISIPVELLSKLKYKQDDSGKFFLVIDGIVIERVTENGFKRLQLTAAYRPAETATSAASTKELVE